jgi:nucleoside-diphosphate-sugar epimerase
VNSGTSLNRIFNVTDGKFHTLKDIIESICFALGRKPPRLCLPVGPIRGLADLVEKGSNAIGIKPPVSKAMIDKYNTPQKLDKGIRWMLACHTKKEDGYGKEHAKGPR